MTDKKHSITIKGVFNGIYEWGKGFKDSNTFSAWNRFWEMEFPKKKPPFWKYADGDDFGGCGHLSCIGGSIYMHPMDFHTTLISDGCVCISTVDGKDYYNHFSSELEELTKICEECAEFCGGTFSLYISPEFEIEIPRPTIEYDKELSIKEYCAEIKEGTYIY